MDCRIIFFFWLLKYCITGSTKKINEKALKGESVFLNGKIKKKRDKNSKHFYGKFLRCRMNSLIQKIFLDLE